MTAGRSLLDAFTFLRVLVRRFRCSIRSSVLRTDMNKVSRGGMVTLLPLKSRSMQRLTMATDIMPVLRLCCMGAPFRFIAAGFARISHRDDRERQACHAETAHLSMDRLPTVAFHALLSRRPVRVDVKGGISAVISVIPDLSDL